MFIFDREVENEMESVRRKLQREIEDLNFSKSSLERQNATLDGELTASRTEVAGLKSSVAQLSSSQAKVLSELESTKVCDLGLGCGTHQAWELSSDPLISDVF